MVSCATMYFCFAKSTVGATASMALSTASIQCNLMRCRQPAGIAQTSDSTCTCRHAAVVIDRLCIWLTKPIVLGGAQMQPVRSSQGRGFTVVTVHFEENMQTLGRAGGVRKRQV
jgi:hypothetical protein